MSKKKMLLKAFCSFILCFICAASYGEICTSSGLTQYKVSGICGTSERTCCEYGEYSEWDTPCKSLCPSSCEYGYTKTDKEYGYYSECCQCVDPKQLKAYNLPNGDAVLLCVCRNSGDESTCTSNEGTWSDDTCSCTCKSPTKEKNCKLEVSYTDNKDRPGTWNPNTCSCSCPADSNLVSAGGCRCKGSSTWNSAQKKCICNLSCSGSGVTLNSEECQCACPSGYSYKGYNSSQFLRRKCENSKVVTYQTSIVKGCQKSCFQTSTGGGYFVLYPNDCNSNPIDYCFHSGGTPKCTGSSYTGCTYS